MILFQVNGDVWDLDRPFEKDSSLQLLKFDDDEGNDISSTFHSLIQLIQFVREILTSF